MWARRAFVCLWALTALLPATGIAGPSAPGWGDDDIRASRTGAAASGEQPAVPRWRGDPMNLLVVIEAGDDHISLVDGDSLQPVHRLRSRADLHDTPQFTPDGRYAFFASRSGWITKFDLWNPGIVAEVRSGLDLRQAALSADGLWLMAGHAAPRTLALFDSGLHLLRTYEAATSDGRTSSRVAAVLDNAARRSFVVALQDVAELWEISYDPRAEPIFDGLVHDYRLGEGLAKSGTFGVRRTLLDGALHDIRLEARGRHVMGVMRPLDAAASAPPARGETILQVVHLDIRRRIGDQPATGRPPARACPRGKAAHTPSLEALPRALEFRSQGRAALACLSMEDGALIIYDAQTLDESARLPMRMPVALAHVGHAIESAARAAR